MIVSLNQLQPGQHARVESLDEENRDDLRKVLTLGILPGDEVELIRRSPSIVFAHGATQFALDARLAACIRVEI